MCGVILLIWFQLTRSVCHNLLVLHENTTKSLQRSITKDLIGLGLIRRGKNRSRNELLFECFECHITIRSPRVLDILLQQVGKRLGNLGEVLNEPSAIACETEETSELFDILRRFPVDNSFNLLGVNRNALGRDNMAKIEDFIKPEFTFGELHIETVLTEPIRMRSWEYPLH